VKSKARHLLDNSTEAMLAAIEIYNKPSFEYRDETFAILALNAWELLLKARILQIDGNRLAAILEYERRRRADGSASQMLYRKQNRAGNSLTVGLFRAYDRLVNDYGDKIDPAIRANLEALSEIRDNAIHFFNRPVDMAIAVHEIATASVKNYVNSVRQWFGVDLARYRIFLMPLAFFAGPMTVEGINFNAQERQMLSYLANKRDVEGDEPDRDFNVALRVEVKLKRSKDPAGTPFTISNAPDAIAVTLDEEDIRERWPLDYDILNARLKKRYADFKVNAKYHSLRKALERDSRFCRERLLDPGNPKSAKKKFYSAAIVREFDSRYDRAKPEAGMGTESESLR